MVHTGPTDIADDPLDNSCGITQIPENCETKGCIFSAVEDMVKTARLPHPRSSSKMYLCIYRLTYIAWGRHPERRAMMAEAMIPLIKKRQ